MRKQKGVYMKMNKFMIATIACTLMSSTGALAAAARYELTITNGSQMPLSPGAIYVKAGGESAAALGSTPTQGLIQLCQTGNPAQRTVELRALAGVVNVQNTTAMILPGESKTVLIDVPTPASQSIQIETMYGKTKDACVVGSVNSHSLVALQQHVTTEVVTRDAALQTGAFQNPVLPQMSYPGEELCAGAKDAITCVRDLALPTVGAAKTRYFTSYSPSLVSALETRFGNEDVQTLLFSDSGAVQLKLKLKH